MKYGQEFWNQKANGGQGAFEAVYAGKLINLNSNIVSVKDVAGVPTPVKNPYYVATVEAAGQKVRASVNANAYATNPEHWVPGADVDYTVQTKGDYAGRGGWLFYQGMPAFNFETAGLITAAPVQPAAIQPGQPGYVAPVQQPV